ncbi:hypothetical protein ACWCQL_35765 [Streptomyces sp. NPDC002073]
MPFGTLVVRRSGGGTRMVRLDAPELCLATTAEESETVSGWVTVADAEALAALGAEPAGITVKGLTVPRHTPLAVPGDVAVSARFDGGRGRVWVELSWRAGLRGEAGGVRHALAGPVDGCPSEVQECGGIAPARWCPVHGDDQAPAMEWHPAGGICCAELSGALV